MKKRSKNRPVCHRSLRVEPLESRMVLDGNVRAFIAGGNLFLQGDGQDNEITIEQTSLRQFIVSSRDGSTRINGQTGPRTFTRVGKNLDITLGRGNDVVEILGSSADAVTVSNRLNIDMGNGADQVLLTEVHAIGLHVNTGSGNDTVNAGEDGASGGLEITKEAVIVTGSGRDDVRIANSLFKRFLVLDMGGSNDETSISDTRFRKRSTVIGGSGFDTLNRENNNGKVKFISFERTNNFVNEPGPVAPVAADDAGSITEDATPNTVTGNVLTNDTSATGTKTVTAVNGASGSVGQTINGQFGTFNIASNGAFTYTLDNSNATVNALNNGQTLTDSMNYTLSDGSATDVGTLRVTIQGTTDLAAVADSGSVTEDAAAVNSTTGNVLTNDTGGTGTKTVTAVNGSTSSVGVDVTRDHGTFRINADGTYTYTLDNADPDLATLDNGETLTDSITYTVTAGGATSTATLTITINGTTELAAVADSGSVTEDAAAVNSTTGNVLTNDTGGAGTKTVTAVNGSTSSVGVDVTRDHGTFRINADGTYTYTLDNADPDLATLDDGETLTDSITYTVTAGGSTSTATLTITINGTTELAAVADSGSVTEDAAAVNSTTGNVLTNDTGGEGTKTVTAVNDSTSSVGVDVTRDHGTFRINADGTYTYTLNNADPALATLDDGETLTDSITYTVTAGGSTSTATLTITINGTTELNAVNDADDVTEDATPATATGNVLTNDEGGEGTKTVTEVDGASANVGVDIAGDENHGTFHINADGTYTYTLNNADTAVNDLNNGQQLTDSITYEVTAGGVSATAMLTITIQGHTELVAGDDTATVTEDTDPTDSGDVLSNDTGGNGTLSVTEVAGQATNVGVDVDGAHGTFHINSDGSFTYTINANDTAVSDLNDGQTLPDTINYTVSDGIATATGTINVTIQGTTDI